MTNHSINHNNCINRRERKAARERNYIKAAYYAADHDRRFGSRSWTIVCAFRRPVDFGRSSGKEA